MEQDLAMKSLHMFRDEMSMKEGPIKDISALNDLLLEHVDLLNTKIELQRMEVENLLKEQIIYPKVLCVS